MVPLAGPAGTVVAASSDGITVACGRGALRLTELQRAGGKRLSAAQFLQGQSSLIGDRFDAGLA
jgi:methionyl-tRNA formyltransferase